MTIMLQIQLFLINQHGVSKESLVNIRKRHIKVFVELYEGIVNLLHRQCVTYSFGFSQFLYMVFHQRAYGCLDFWLDCPTRVAAVYSLLSASSSSTSSESSLLFCAMSFSIMILLGQLRFGLFF